MGGSIAKTQKLTYTTDIYIYIYFRDRIKAPFTVLGTFRA